METILEEIWKKLGSAQYLVLRNYENVCEDLKNGGDIDILCDSKKELSFAIDLKPRFSRDNEFNCKTVINGIDIPIDVRSVGDGYYDAKWERDMLTRRIERWSFYIISDYDEKYALLYHALLHKREVPEKYISYFQKQFKECSLDQMIVELAAFMNKNGYYPVIPQDGGVCFNRDNYELIKRKIDYEKCK